MCELLSSYDNNMIQYTLGKDTKLSLNTNNLKKIFEKKIIGKEILTFLKDIKGKNKLNNKDSLKLKKVSLDSFKKYKIESNIAPNLSFNLKQSFNINEEKIPLVEYNDKKMNSQIPYDYLMDIYQNLLTEEIEVTINRNYLETQKNINQKMRAILVDWLIDVHNKFKLINETLFLSINILDRYLSLKTVSKTKLQLVGVSCLFIACKYEEIFSPEIRDFVFIMNDSWKKGDILKTECDILKTLKFNVTIPSSLKFYEILTVEHGFNEKECSIGKYLLEMFLIDSKYNNYLPSTIANAVIYIILKMSNIESFNNYLLFLKVNDEVEVKKCTLDILFIYDCIQTSPYQAVIKKYTLKKNNEVVYTKIC